MADDALFIGWGEVVRGREEKAVEVFNETVQYYGQLQQDGKIESFEPYFLARTAVTSGDSCCCTASASSSTRSCAARSSSGFRRG